MAKNQSEGDGHNVVRILCIVFAALFGCGAVACVCCYIALSLDVLFIPIALCAVFAIILTTYAIYSKG